MQGWLGPNTHFSATLEMLLLGPFLSPFASGICLCLFALMKTGKEVPEPDVRCGRGVRCGTDLRASSSKTISFTWPLRAFFFAAMALWDWVRRARLLVLMRGAGA
jgi:hypothetical protein